MSREMPSSEITVEQKAARDGGNLVKVGNIIFYFAEEGRNKKTKKHSYYNAWRPVPSFPYISLIQRRSRERPTVFRVFLAEDEWS